VRIRGDQRVIYQKKVKAAGIISDVANGYGPGLGLRATDGRDKKKRGKVPRGQSIPVKGDVCYFGQRKKKVILRISGERKNCTR